MLKVLDTFPVGNNTSVTISGDGADLENGKVLRGSDNKDYTILSVAMLSGVEASEIGKSTTLLIKGRCNVDILYRQ